MLNTFSDSIRDRQEEKKRLTPVEEKRLKSRHKELENTIEKLSSQQPQSEGKESFFEKIRKKGSVSEKNLPQQSILSQSTANTTRSVPIVTKNIGDKHSDIKPFTGAWQYPESSLLTRHPK